MAGETSPQVTTFGHEGRVLPCDVNVTSMDDLTSRSSGNNAHVTGSSSKRRENIFSCGMLMVGYFCFVSNSNEKVFHLERASSVVGENVV